MINLSIFNEDFLMQLISFDLDSYLYIISLVIIFTHIVFLRKLNEELLEVFLI